MAPSLSRGLDSQVEFTINGKSFKVGEEIGGDISLNTFIREYAHLKGTKFMCMEGGCGTCIVSAKFTRPSSHKAVTQAVNSCMIPVLACHGWEITTVEGVGNKHKGYHKVQKRLTAANGSQCGYCTPGMVMNMYSLLQENPNMTMKEIENSFGGNICRCTGYRPIMDAFKTFAVDAPKELIQRIADIEDTVCPNTGQLCKGTCNGESSCANGAVPHSVDTKKSMIFHLKEGSEWYRPTSIKEICEIFDMIGNKNYRIIAGHTGQGVYRIEHKPDVYIDVNGVSELYSTDVQSGSLTLGGNISLTDAMELFYKLAKENPTNFAYCKTLGDHIDLIANVPVRNAGTFAGNLYMKHAYKEFPSDVYLFLETVGAKLVIRDTSGGDNTMGLLQYLTTDMNKKIISKIILPTLKDSEYVVTSYKIMPRAQNAHAYVNAGFMFRCDKKDKFRVLEKPTVVFGGINPEFTHATKTEEYLNGKVLIDTAVVQKALEILESELKPDHVLPDATPEYRRGLALSLMYKFFLSLSPDAVNPKYRSGGSILERGVSSGKQDFDTNKNVWPLNKPVPKIEALIQSSGEAEYTNDVPRFPGEVWAQLVLCDKAGAEILSIDASKALAIPGVIAFFQAKDIPGENSFCPKNNKLFYPTQEKVFADKKTQYSGQAIGLIVAESLALATAAAKKVKVNYGKQDEVMYDMKKIVQDKITSRITQVSSKDPQTKKDNVKFKVKGDVNVPNQYHNFMELLSCVAVPTEDNLDIYPTSQWPCIVQDAIYEAVNIPEHRMNVRVRRLGGGYGGKITLASHTGVAAALAAVKLHRPVRLVVSLETGMHWGGKRFPIYSQYEAGVDENGAIQYLDLNMYQDDGYSPNESAMGLGTLHHLPTCYLSDTWNVKGFGVRTENPSNTWCRAPGSVEAIATIETILEHIAKVTGKDPEQVRIANMSNEHPCIQMMTEVKALADYDSRLKAVETFNKENRWKKRGLSLVPMDYPFGYFGQFHASVSIYKHDGTVAIGHGAIEMGQGCNTKAAQVAAYTLGLDLEMITVKPTDSFTSPNNFVTGGSAGSEIVSYAVKRACEEINERLKPFKEKLGEKATWLEVITAAYEGNTSLRAQYMFKSDDLKPYNIYGVIVTEVECDILTGQYQVVRMDVVEDAGESLSPEIDIGQVEGAIVMGLGLFTTEELVNHPTTGHLLTDRTWNYKPPGAKDIPIDFRITLRKKSPNPAGVLRSKATGEPPFCLTVSVPFALRRALESARQESGKVNDEWFTLELPITRERQWLASLNSREDYKI